MDNICEWLNDDISAVVSEMAGFFFQNGAQKFGVSVQYLSMICFELFLLSK